MSKTLGFLIFVLIMIGPIGVGLIIAVPLVGAIVRLRANYTPKGLQLDQEDTDTESQARVGPAVDGVVNMLRRVHRIEGWSGMYKGFIPALISTIAITLWAILTIPGHAKYRPCSQVYVPATSILHGLLYGMGALLVAIPYEIMFNRAVCTPHRLPWLKPMQALRALLTPYERRKPWVLYLTPGLLVARMLILIWLVAVAQVVRAKLLPSLSRGLSDVHDTDDQARMTKHLKPVKLLIFLLFSMASIIIVCPLEVLATRLSVQRNHPSTDADRTIDGASDPMPDYIGEEEDVIALRSEDDPYRSLLDCGKRMVNEEGAGSLFRAWWLTMIAVTLGSFA